MQIITGAATPVNGGSGSRGWDGSVERGVWVSMGVCFVGAVVGAFLV